MRMRMRIHRSRAIMGQWEESDEEVEEGGQAGKRDKQQKGRG